MNRINIKKNIEDTLAGAGVFNADIRVQSDGNSRWKVAVITPHFEGLDLNQRIAATGIADLETSWLDLLSPSEAEWAGQLPADIDSAALPAWPEALSRAGQQSSQPIFASDLDQDIERPAITTFYSLRGGVGRSTSLASTARILADRGRKVVAMDMDLEAPGLASLFGVGSQVRDAHGVVELLYSIDIGLENIDLSKHLIKIGSDDLFCLPAGYPSSDYARKLGLLDPTAWYNEDRNPLTILLDLIRNDLPFKPDHILIDSRTGITPFSAPLLFDVPDLAVIVFFPHDQARRGTELLTNALISSVGSRQVQDVAITPEPRFIASPVPGGESFDKYSMRAKEWVAEWIQPLNAKRSGRAPFLENDITHIIPYREAHASSDHISVNRKDWQDYELVADWVDRLLPSDVQSPMIASIPSKKDQILSELRFPTGTAESQNDLLETFVETSTIKRALSPDIPLIRGRKGTGKTALFRLLSESGEQRAIKIVAPQPLQGGMQWTWSSEAFRAADEILSATSLTWSFFWSFFIAARCHFQDIERSAIPSSISELLLGEELSEISIVGLLERVSKLPRQELIIGEWLRQIDKNFPELTFLIFDGLDTGFGNTSADRNRRRESTEGLFTFLTDRASQFKNLKLKIVLREDIWRQLRFDNKSHLFGRDVSLSWTDSEEFFKVVLIHARKSKAFRDVLAQDRLLTVIANDDPEIWPVEAVSRGWILLIGERMKGSGTTYTQNWVWNRLADSNADRNPRYLLMLMNLVTAWEAKEHTRSRYDRSVIRPRALEQQLGEVSTWAVGALREEFEELTPLQDLLANERTPFPAELLSQIGSEIVGLAREVGLLGIYEEKDGSPERYAVPEIYRLALGMKRRGQA